MKKVLLLFSALCVLLAACGSESLSLPTTLVSSSAPTPSASPAAPPTAEAPSPTPKPKELSSTLGVSAEFAARLKEEGIDKTVNPNGSIKNVILGWDVNGTPKTAENVKVVATGINFATDWQGMALKNEDGRLINVKMDIHNQGYPDGIVTKIDEEGRVLHWNEWSRRWVASLPVDSDIAKGTFYPSGRRDLVIETALLNPDLNKVFSPEAVRNFAGWRMLSEYNKRTSTSAVYLIPHNYDSIEIVRGPDGNPTMWIEIDKDGIWHKSVLMRLLNPSKMDDVKGDETLLVLGDPGVLTGLDGGGFRPNFRAMLEDFVLPKVGGWDNQMPLIALGVRGEYFLRAGVIPFGSIPYLDEILEWPGNDPSALSSFGPDVDRLMDEAEKSSRGAAQINLSGGGMDYFDPIHPGLQKMLVPIEFALRK